MNFFKSAALALCLVSTSVSAVDEWRSLKKSANFELMVKPSTLKQADDFAKVWTTTSYYRAQYTQDGLAYRSNKLLLEFHCGEDVYRVLMSELTNGMKGKGQIIRSVDVITPWQRVGVDTPEETFEKFACKSSR